MGQTRLVFGRRLHTLVVSHSRVVTGLLLALLVSLASILSPHDAQAIGPNAMRAGFDGNTLAANDDDSTGLVAFGFSVNFFGVSRSGGYVNNNGTS